MSGNPYGSPQQPGGTPPMGYAPPPQSPQVGFAVTSMVLGILAILSDCCCWLAGLPLGLLAILFGILALNVVKAGTGGGKGMAIAGLVCGIAAILLGILSLVLGLVVNIPNLMQKIQQQRGL